MLRQGHWRGCPLLEMMLDTGNIHLNGGNALRMAIDGGNVELVLGVLEHLDLDTLNGEDFHWVHLKTTDSTQPRPEEDAIARVPSLLYLLHECLG